MAFLAIVPFAIDHILFSYITSFPHYFPFLQFVLDWSWYGHQLIFPQTKTGQTRTAWYDWTAPPAVGKWFCQPGSLRTKRFDWLVSNRLLLFDIFRSYISCLKWTNGTIIQRALPMRIYAAICQRNHAVILDLRWHGCADLGTTDSAGVQSELEVTFPNFRLNLLAIRENRIHAGWEVVRQISH